MQAFLAVTAGKPAYRLRAADTVREYAQVVRQRSPQEKSGNPYSCADRASAIDLTQSQERLTKVSK